ncbi:MAG TPA: phosphotransferase family protein [Anaerolineae bacterium]|nr:phosphotransferase family protein [Anaerolineae bacterium]
MACAWLDRAEVVRQGEELDVGRLEGYLKGRLPDLGGRLEVAQFPRGFSNLTYLLRFGERQLVLRRPPFGAKIKSAHDMGREFRILSGLIKVYPKVPRPLLYCQDETVIGAPFYVMSRLKGVILRPQMPAEMIPPPALMSGIADAFVDNLLVLHGVDYEAAGLGDLGRPEGYIGRQISGWSKRYRAAQTDDIAELERAAAWLADEQPAEAEATLIHNDYKYDNLVLDPDDWSSIIGVLDWEMATIGDPLMDLGTSLGYWVEEGDPEEIQALRLSPTNVPGNPSREELLDRYARQSGREVPKPAFYYVYGLFKLSVIVQQIYARYRRGDTQDPRFSNLIQAVRACGRMAVAAIEKGQISP